MNNEVDNKLVCRFTGQKRQSNQKYLQKKAERYGTTINEIREHYVTKPALMDVQAKLKTNQVGEVLTELDVSGQTLEKILKFNGKSTKTLDNYKGAKVAADPADPFPTTEEPVLVEAAV